MGAAISGPIRKLRIRVSKSLNTNYLAETDGEVNAVYTGGGSDTMVRGFEDTFTPPTTMRDANGGSASGVLRDSGISFSVTKGHYWKVTFTGIGSCVVFWIPEN